MPEYTATPHSTAINRSWSLDLLARVPLPILRLAGALVGTVWYALHKTHRKTVHRNIAFAFPHWEGPQVLKTARKAFRCFGRIVVENLQLAVLTPAEIMGRSRIEGAEHLTTALAQNKGVFMVSAHIGNWEVGLQAMTCHFNRPFMSVAKKFKNPFLDRWIRKMRHRMGAPVLDKKGAMASMTKVLKQGEIVGVLIDISRQEDGIDIEFFGRKATATPAAALIALRRKCPVVPVTFPRDPDGKIVARIGKPFDLVRTKSLRDDLRVNTQTMSDYIVEMIREHPEQWWWIMKRWKDYFPGLYPEHYRRQARRLHHRLERKKRRIKALKESQLNR